MFLPPPFGTAADPGDLEAWGRPIATYDAGEATLRIDDDDPLVLTKLNVGPHLSKGIGASIMWANSDGWAVRLIGPYGRVEGAFTTGLLPSESGMVTIERVDKGYWSMSFSDGCTVEIDSMTETHLAGSASCRSLRWVDSSGTAGYNGDTLPFVQGEAAFDAEITFEATGNGATPSPTP